MKAKLESESVRAQKPGRKRMKKIERITVDNIVARDEPGGNRNRTININAQHKVRIHKYSHNKNDLYEILLNSVLTFRL